MKPLLPFFILFYLQPITAGNNFCVLEKDTVDVGTILFGEQKSNIIRIYFFKPGSIQSQRSDTVKLKFYKKLAYIKSIDWEEIDYGFSPSPNARPAYMDSLHANITIRNIEGNTGAFCKKIALIRYWEKDTAYIFIKGTFKDTEMKRTWVNKKITNTTESYFTKGRIDSVRYITPTNKHFKTIFYDNNKPIHGITLFEPCAKIVLENKKYNFGIVEKDGNGVGVFIFKNEGDSPLIFSNCTSSCGCLVAECPREPILPGAEGKIKFKYNTNVVGRFHKSLTILTNSCENSVLTLLLEGEVCPPKEEKQWNDK